MSLHAALREDDAPLVPAPRGIPLPADEEEEYIPLKKRRLLEAQKLHSRLGHAAPVVAHEREREELPAPPVRLAVPMLRLLLTRRGEQDERVSLLVRAAEMKRDGREEDAGERRVREEQAILDNVMVRRNRQRLLRPTHSRACRRRRPSCPSRSWRWGLSTLLLWRRAGSHLHTSGL